MNSLYTKEFIGEWAEKRGIHDQLVIATKYGASYKRGAADIKTKINYAGNSSKSMYLSVEASLKKLGIDIIYVHCACFSLLGRIYLTIY